MTNEDRIDVLKTKKKIIDNVSPSFCTAKWLQTTLYLQNGFNHSCHHPSPHKIPLKELEDNPAALHNSLFKKEQRKKMLAGIRPTECNYCWKIEDLGKNYFSDRHYKTADTWAWDRFEEVANSKYDNNLDPSYLEISFSNVCNFKCAYCSSDVSSKWLEEINEFGSYPTTNANHDLHWLKETGKFPYKNSEYNPYLDAFWKWFPTVFESLKVCRITGGEPLLSKDTWKLFDYVLSQKSTKKVIAVNSNLCVNDNFIDKLIVYINKLQKENYEFQLYTSIESINAKAEYSRYGINFNSWKKNLEKILQLTNINVGIMTTVNVLSVTDFVNFMQMIMDLRAIYNLDFAYNRIPISINYLRWPPYLDVSILPKDLKVNLKKEIINYCQQWLKYYKKEKYARLYLEEWNQIQRFCDYLENSNAELDHVIDFKKFIIEYDRRRKTNFLEIYPEYINFFRNINV